MHNESDLFDLLDEMENGPPPCPHSPSVSNGGFGLETDPASDYYLEWVHGHPDCRRSKVPGDHKEKLPTVGWDPKKGKDVPCPAPKRSKLKTTS